MALEIFFCSFIFFVPVHPYFYPFTNFFTCPNDWLADLCIKLWLRVKQSMPWQHGHYSVKGRIWVCALSHLFPTHLFPVRVEHSREHHLWSTTWMTLSKWRWQAARWRLRLLSTPRPLTWLAWILQSSVITNLITLITRYYITSIILIFIIWVHKSMYFQPNKDSRSFDSD